jgi:hypothetical protein
MENVIQTYLRNEFDSIHDYNRHAGEVAEAFHVLVVANFPAGFVHFFIRCIRSRVANCAALLITGLSSKPNLCLGAMVVERVTKLHKALLNRVCQPA